MARGGTAITEMPGDTRVVVLVAAIVLAGVSLYLSPFWQASAELSHGWLAPLCTIALSWESRREPDFFATSPAWIRSGTLWTGVICGSFLAVIAGYAALAQGLSHPQTAFLVGATTASFLSVTAMTLARTSRPFVAMNGASLAGAALWIFVAPLPSGSLASLTLSLQNGITTAAVAVLHLFGFPAIRHGNIIELSTAMVGVEEACSGIRSLMACLFTGLVLGGLFLRGWSVRLILLAAAGLLAVATNLGRSVFLCLLAAKGVDIRIFWHEFTGYAVLGLTALLLLALIQLLPGYGRRAAPSISPRPPPLPVSKTGNIPIGVFATVAALCIAGVVLKVAPRTERDDSPPDLGALLAIEAAGWSRRTDDSITAYRDSLGTPWLHQETYRRDQTQLTVFIAYWPSNRSTFGAVSLHSPNICLPGSGWTERLYSENNARYPIPSPQTFLFEKEGYPQYVWFWHIFDHRVISPSAGLYPWQLGPVLWRPGMHARAAQWVIRISSNRPLESLQDEPIISDLVRRLNDRALLPRH